MAGSGMGAGDKGVEAFNLVRKTIGDKEFKRPVGHGWLRAEAGVAQAVEHFVGSERAVLLQKNFQRFAANRRESQPFRLAMRLGRSEPGADARPVIVFFKPDRVAG